jgi:hypothetical protein
MVRREVLSVMGELLGGNPASYTRTCFTRTLSHTRARARTHTPTHKHCVPVALFRRLHAVVLHRLDFAPERVGRNSRTDWRGCLPGGPCSGALHLHKFALGLAAHRRRECRYSGRLVVRACVWRDHWAGGRAGGSVAGWAGVHRPKFMTI